LDRLRRWRVTVFCSDHWAGYRQELAPERLYQSKAETVAIERNNGRQRHWFARFRRRTVVVSRCRRMVDLTMALFARFHVNGTLDDLESFFR